MSKILNAMTIDVEDYFQVDALSSQIKPEEWDKHDAGRVVDNTHRIMDLFDEANIKATFFTLGWVAERYPDLVKDIDARGHEVASHGYSHQLIYKQTPEVFREETLKSKKILEDIIQKPIRGYRAASYSITNQSLWAIDTLIEAGFEYDSSIFPVNHDVYGIPNFPKHPHVYKDSEAGDIVEFPISSVKFLGYQMPVAGGGYFRLYPYWLTRFGLNKINRVSDEFVFYLHPWEVDPDQPRVEGISWKSKFRHYNNLGKCHHRLRRLVNDFEFTTVEKLLQQKQLLSASNQ